MKKNEHNFKPAFSLMEMMIVLLIISIIAAVSAPMVTRKVSRDAQTGDSPWVYTNLAGSAAFNLRGNNDVTSVIGGTRAPDIQHSRLFINAGKSGDNNLFPAIAFGRDNTYHSHILTDENSYVFGTYRPDGSANLPSQYISIGSGQNLTTTDGSTGMVAIGNGVTVGSGDTVAIGKGAEASSQGSIAIGSGAHATGENGIAIGRGASAPANHIAIGNGVTIEEGADETIKIGDAIDTVAVGTLLAREGANINVKTDLPFNIVSGDNNLLTVDSEGTITATGSNFTLDSDGKINDTISTDGDGMVVEGNIVVTGDIDVTSSITVGQNAIVSGTVTAASFIQASDRRLKNVGVKFKGGLEELKKLDLYHFTYKKDDSKTQHVGVIAQDLQKVFPDAVTADDDGYLMIRWEDMFYALINAVKELDNKITAVVERVQANFDEITKLKATIAEQQKTIKELKAQNADFEKRLAKLEKKTVKEELE